MSLFISVNIRIGLLYVLFVGVIAKNCRGSFNYGRLFYRTMNYNKIKGELFIGAMNFGFRLHKDNRSATTCNSMIRPMKDTNGQFYIFNYATGKCPFDPDAYNTAIMIFKNETHAVYLGIMLSVECNSPQIHLETILGKDITWFRCNRSEKDNKLEEKANKYSFENHSLIISSVSNQDAGCYTCKSGGMEIYNLNLTKPCIVNSGQTSHLMLISSSYVTATIFPKNIVKTKANNLQNFGKMEAMPDKYSFENYSFIAESANNQDKGYYNCKINETFVYKYNLANSRTYSEDSNYVWQNILYVMEIYILYGVEIYILMNIQHERIHVFNAGIIIQKSAYLWIRYIK